jgi:hypothetical protein
VGIEFTCLPGSCNLTADQYEAGVALNAAIVKATKDLAGFQMPYTHVGGCSITTPGFKEHGDGATPTRCSWDPKVHTDNPISVWGGGRPGVDVGKGWDAFLADVRNMVEGGAGGGEDLTDDQAKQLQQTRDWTRGLVRGVLASGNDAKASTEETNGYNAGQKVLGIFQWQKGFTDFTTGKPKPEDPEAAMGWQAAKAMLAQ